MRIKLDENIGERGRDLLAAAGHDVTTAYEQRLAGVSDEFLSDVCGTEDRILVTLDHDFGQLLRFPLRSRGGVVVLELPPKPTPESFHMRIREFLAALRTQPPPVGQLWLVEPGRIRIRRRDDFEDPR